MVSSATCVAATTCASVAPDSTGPWCSLGQGTQAVALSMALQIQTLMGNDQGVNLVPKLLVALEIPSRRRSVFVEDLDGVAVAIAKHETVGVDLISFGDPSDLRPIHGADAKVSERAARA